MAEIRNEHLAALYPSVYWMAGSGTQCSFSMAPAKAHNLADDQPPSRSNGFLGALAADVDMRMIEAVDREFGVVQELAPTGVVACRRKARSAIQCGSSTSSRFQHQMMYGAVSFATEMLMSSNPMQQKGFDPDWLAQLAEEQCPEKPWLPEALRRCKDGVWESEAYVHFVSRARANKKGAEWQFAESVYLEDTKEDYMLDILTGHRIGGIEFLSRIPQGYNEPDPPAALKIDGLDTLLDRMTTKK
jgi:hypothetical protein